MTLATNVQRAARVIKEAAMWLDSDIRQGAYATEGSMSQVDLQETEKTLRDLADRVADRRARLLGAAQ